MTEAGVSTMLEQTLNLGASANRYASAAINKICFGAYRNMYCRVKLLELNFRVIVRSYSCRRRTEVYSIP